MAAGSVKIEGTDGLIAKLRTLDTKAQTWINGALRKAARPIVQAAKPSAPVRTGALRRSLGFVVRKGRRGQGYAVIGARRGMGVELDNGMYVDPAKYAHLVEGGASPHEVGTRKGEKRLHPGARKQPFLGPAVQAVGPNALQIVRQELEHRISEAERLF